MILLQKLKTWEIENVYIIWILDIIVSCYLKNNVKRSVDLTFINDDNIKENLLHEKSCHLDNIETA